MKEQERSGRPHTPVTNAQPPAALLLQQPAHATMVHTDQRRADARKCSFISMPFAQSFTDRYTFGIKQPLEQAGIVCKRVDHVYQPGGILETITAQIKDADLVVGDLTGQNPNVLFEIGLAYALNKVVILLVEEITDIPSNLRDQRHIIYHGSITQLHEELTRYLAILTRDRAQ